MLREIQSTCSPDTGSLAISETCSKIMLQIHRSPSLFGFLSGSQFIKAFKYRINVAVALLILNHPDQGEMYRTYSLSLSLVL